MAPYSDTNDNETYASSGGMATTHTADSGGTHNRPDMYIFPQALCYTNYRNFKSDVDKFLKELKALSKIYSAQWILRAGYKFRFNPPDLGVPLSILLFRRILRCNRRGMGLRLRRNN